jgi:ankyrin repeat protein
MKRIESQGPESNELAKTILLWIVHARTPLSARQLQHALGVTPNAEAISEDDIPTIRTLLSVCAGLVTIDVASNNIRLIHYTTQEYFQQTQGRWFPDAQRQITRTCVKYLSYKTFSVSSQTFYDIDMQQGVHSFYQYAALEWGHHAGASPAMPEVIDFLLHTEQENRTIYSCESLDGIYLGIAEVCPGRVSALNVAIHFGLIYAVPALLGGYYGSTVDRWHATLIGHATGHGQAAVVKLLLEIATTGVDDKTYYGTTPLGQAAEMGYTEVVQLLLDTRRVDINTKNQAGQTPLALAAKTGHVEVVKLLLATGRARIDDKDRAGQTPLALAAESGHCDIMRLLLETGEVDVNSKDGFRRTPLATAASKGHDQVVGLLIGIDSTDIDVKDVSNSTPLALAAESGNLKAVELLTKTGKVDVYSRNWAGYAPWAQAVKAGHKEVARMLLKVVGLAMPTTEVYLSDDFHIDGQVYFANC